MDERLAAALALDRGVCVRGGQETTELPGGCVVKHAGLPAVYHLNLVRLSAPMAPGCDAAALEALCDRWLGDRDHRRVSLDDAEVGEQVATELIRRGWERDRTVFMALESDPSLALRDTRAREISDDELRTIQRLINREEDYGPHATPDLAERLADAQAALRAGTAARGFGAGVNDGLQSMCTLFLDPDVSGLRVAMVESVGTLRAHRERGLAKAVVSASLLAAAEWDAQLIVVPADADDWPQLLYAGLGFVPVGRQVTFTLHDARRREGARGAL